MEPKLKFVRKQNIILTRWTVGVIAMDPNKNMQGGILFYNINTGRHPHRTSKEDYTILPDVIITGTVWAQAKQFCNNFTRVPQLEFFSSHVLLCVIVG